MSPLQGSMGALHLSCLARWLLESWRDACELCGVRYNTVRELRHSTVPAAVWAWLRDGGVAKGLRTDAVLCGVLTPVTAAGAYSCLLAADYYARAPYSDLSPANWTAMALLLVALMIVLGYFLWMYITVRFHGLAWFHWWQSHFVIRVLHGDLSFQLAVVRQGRGSVRIVDV